MSNKKIIILIIVLITLLMIIIVAPSFTKIEEQMYWGSDINSVEKIILKSDSKEFSIYVPNSFRMEEKHTFIQLTSIDGGNISISRIASEYDNLIDHLSDLVIRNQLQIEYLTEISRKENSENVYVYIRNNDTTTELSYDYFYYVDGWVYSISTSNKELYEELEKIAESFEYLGK